MGENHPKKKDPRPKRRRDKDNPYEIYTVGIHTDNPHYYISFTDNMGVYRELEIKKDLFEIFDRFELDDISFLNEVYNHYEHYKRSESSLNTKAMEQPETVEEIIMQHIQNEQLHSAIAMLPDKQRYRLILYYFYNFSYAKIAEMEGCKYQTIQESIHAAIKKIKKILN